MMQYIKYLLMLGFKDGKYNRYLVENTTGRKKLIKGKHYYLIIKLVFIKYKIIDDYFFKLFVK